MRHQVEQRELRRVRLAVEHALRGERAVHVHPVDAADEPASSHASTLCATPRACRCSYASTMSVRDPGPVLSRAWRVGAPVDDPREIRVDGQAESTVATRVLEAPRDVQVGEVENAALRRREPEQRQARARATGRCRCGRRGAGCRDGGRRRRRPARRGSPSADRGSGEPARRPHPVANTPDRSSPVSCRLTSHRRRAVVSS